MSPEEWTAVELSLRVATVSSLVMAVPAVLLARWLARARGLVGRAVDAVVVLPLVLPPVVLGFLLLQLFGRNGALGGVLEALGLPLAFTWFGAALASAVLGFPLVVRTARQGFEAVDPGLRQAARSLGAGPLRVFWTVDLPLAAPALVAGFALGFARSLGEFGATITFAGNLPGETRTLPLAIWSALQSPRTTGTAWRLTLVAVGLSLAASLAGELLLAAQRRRAGRAG